MIVTLVPEPATPAALAEFDAIIGSASGAPKVAVDFYQGAVAMSYPARFACDHPVEITLASVVPRPGEVRYMERHAQHTQALIPLGGKPFIVVMTPPGAGELPDLALLRYGHARAEAMGVAIQFSQQNAEHTNFPDESFDLVCSSAMLHETSAKGMRQIFKECHRLLKPGGVMCHVDVPPRHEHLSLWDQMRCDFESHYNNEPFMTSLARTDWMKVATEAGFAADRVGIGYRKGTVFLNPNTEDFFTEGHPEGRALMGSWYACAAMKD